MSEHKFFGAHYDRTYNFGHIMQVATIILAGLSLFVAQSTYNATTELRLRENEIARDKWIPVIEEIVKQQSNTALRFDGVGRALIEVRDVNRDLVNAVNAQSNRLTKVETVLELQIKTNTAIEPEPILK